MKLLFIGQERSQLAQDRGVYWEDEAQCANQLFRALRANGIDPNKDKNIDQKSLNKINKWEGEKIGMGNIVGRMLTHLKIDHTKIVHPSARGKIRAKELYIQHIRERLKKVKKNA